MRICTVYDSKAEAYLMPFFTPTSATAIRAWSAIVNEQGHEFNVHPADYTLFEIGKWNDVEGHIEMHKAKINLGVAIEMMRDQLAIKRQLEAKFEEAKQPGADVNKIQREMRGIHGGE